MHVISQNSGKIGYSRNLPGNDYVKFLFWNSHSVRYTVNVALPKPFRKLFESTTREAVVASIMDTKL